MTCITNLKKKLDLNQNNTSNLLVFPKRSMKTGQTFKTKSRKITPTLFNMFDTNLAELSNLNTYTKQTLQFNKNIRMYCLKQM